MQNINTPEYWDKKYSAKEWNMFIDIHKKQMYDCVAGYLNYTERILNVGCGIGTFENYWKDKKGLRIVGIDYSKEIIKQNKKHFEGYDNLRFYCGNIEQYELISDVDDIFDIVLCFEVLEHITDYRKALKNINTACKEGGKIFISVPNKNNVQSDEHVHVFENDSFMKVLNEYMTVLKVRYINNIVANHVRNLMYVCEPRKEVLNG